MVSLLLQLVQHQPLLFLELLQVLLPQLLLQFLLQLPLPEAVEEQLHQQEEQILALHRKAACLPSDPSSA